MLSNTCCNHFVHTTLKTHLTSISSMPSSNWRQTVVEYAKRVPRWCFASFALLWAYSCVTVGDRGSRPRKSWSVVSLWAAIDQDSRMVACFTRHRFHRWLVSSFWSLNRNLTLGTKIYHRILRLIIGRLTDSLKNFFKIIIWCQHYFNFVLYLT